MRNIMPKKPETLAEYVHRNRTAAGMKQHTLAKAAKISQSYVSGIERGINVDVDPKYVRAIATALGVDTSEALAVAGEAKGYLPTEAKPDFVIRVSHKYGVLDEDRKAYVKETVEAAIEGAYRTMVTRRTPSGEIVQASPDATDEMLGYADAAAAAIRASTLLDD